MAWKAFTMPIVVPSRTDELSAVAPIGTQNARATLELGEDDQHLAFHRALEPSRCRRRSDGGAMGYAATASPSEEVRRRARAPRANPCSSRPWRDQPGRDLSSWIARENCGANFRVALALFLILISFCTTMRERVDRHAQQQDDDDALREHPGTGPQVRSNS